jgi:hypothetical protein
MQKIKFTHIIWILFYLTIFFVLLNNSFNYLDPDLGWHLKVGEQILADKAVPHQELYNYTLEGRTWVDHEWLINAITYWIYENYGYLTLNILFSLMVIVTLIILNLIVRKYVPVINEGKGEAKLNKGHPTTSFGVNNGLVFIIFFQALGIVASLPHLGVRMQEVTLLNLAILLFIIYHYEKNHNWKILLWLPLLFWLWASMHGGFLIGIFIILAWTGIRSAEIIIYRYSLFKKHLTIVFTNIKNISTFFLFSLLSILATFITPYKLKLYQFLNDYKNDFYLTHIMEWFPFYYLPIQYWQLLYLSFIIIAILLIPFYIFKKKMIKSPLWEPAVSVIFLILALKSRRHFPLLFVVSFPMLIGFFSSFLKLPNDNFLNKKWLKQFFIVKPYITIAFLIIAASRLIGTNFTADPFVSFKNKYPHDAALFLKEHPEYNSKRLLPKYGWGGYLIWVLPEKKLFIDGRLPQYPFAGHTLLEEYYEFTHKEKISNKLRQYNIELVLMPNKENYYKLNWFEKYILLLNEEKINKQENHLKNYLEQVKDWELIYSDDVSNIYAKK